MRSFYTVFLVVLLSSSTSLYAQWTEVSSLTGGSVVTSIISFRGDIYACVSGSGVYRSTDNGSNWSKTSVPRAYNTGHFLVYKDELLVFSYGLISRTSDGTSWTTYTSGVDDFLNGVVTNGEAIFLAGSEGIHYSPSGYASWQKIVAPALEDRISAITVDGDRILATTASLNGTLFFSDDLGANWSSFQIGSAPIVDVSFHDDTYYALTTSGLYMSADKGSTWSLSHSSFNAAKLLSTENSIYLATDLTVFRSSDNGITWASSPQISDHNISSIFATDAYAFVGTWGAGIFRSNAALSDTFDPKNNGITAVTVNAIEVVAGKLIIGTDYSFVRTSSDNGTSWTQADGNFGLTQGNSTKLFSVGTDIYSLAYYDVMRSSDHGNTWTSVDIGLQDYWVTGGTTLGSLIIIADEKSIFISKDRGITWERRAAGLSTNIRGIYSDGANLYLGTWDGLFKSDDLGKSWGRISAGLASESVNAFGILNNILFLGTNALYKSSDGGATWELSNIYTVQSLAIKNNFVFHGSLNGIFYSSDYGETWVIFREGFLPESSVSAMGFTDEYIFAGAGNAGGLWKHDRTTFMPPGVDCYSDISSKSFLAGSPIYVKADQTLYSPEGVKIESSNIDQYITVTSQSGPVDYSVEIDADEKLITVLIHDPIVGEAYTLTVAEVENEHGLTSPSVSRIFSAVEDPVTSLDENPNAEKLTLYPNPVEGKFYVTIPGLTDAASNMVILDLSGRKVGEFTLDDQPFPTEVDLSSLPNGMYMVIVSNGSSRYLQKIVKR